MIASRTKLLAFAVILCLPIGLVSFMIPGLYYNIDNDSEYCYFNIASWEFPDSNGQGIYACSFETNSSGSWLPWRTTIFYYNDTLLSMNESKYLRLRVYVNLNQTLVGAASLADGKNFLRVNVSVSNNLGSIVFSLDNMTYEGGHDYTTYYQYWYVNILNFTPLSGELYSIIINYEVYYIP